MYPKLQAKLEEIQVRLDEVLKEEFIDTSLVEDVELNITETNFVRRSFQANAAISLKKILLETVKVESAGNNQILDPKLIEKKHILAAESLIRINRFQELAVQVLVAAISSEKLEVPELAARALGCLDLQVSYDSLSISFFTITSFNGPKGRCVCDEPTGKWKFYPINGEVELCNNKADCARKAG